MAESSNHSDEQALMAFKAAIYVDSYNSFLDWSTNHTFCERTGITCSSRRQHVVSLNLTGMGLLGPISPLQRNLYFFRVLDLSNNSLEGHIPYQIGRLFPLRRLLLSTNQLEGHIPYQLGRLFRLRMLELASNN
ncbi:hypothetical protein SUGI_0376800 [Cryptomeria japonica]|nr:hypothetical protein SUGI_0376800 [Cryptomeria japonica]